MKQRREAVEDSKVRIETQKVEIAKNNTGIGGGQM